MNNFFRKAFFKSLSISCIIFISTSLATANETAISEKASNETPASETSTSKTSTSKTSTSKTSTSKTPSSASTEATETLVKISGNFIQQKFLSFLPNPLLSNGQFQFHQTNQTSAPELTWETLKPINSVLYFDKKGVRQEIDNEIAWNISSDQPAVATLTEVITAVLASDWSALKRYFDIELAEQPETKGSNITVLLTSRDDNLKTVITSMTVEVLPLSVTVEDIKELSAVDDIQQAQVQMLEMHEANGDRTKIEFYY